MIGNFVIYGDSYSTYKGYIPEGYPTYYTPDEVPPTDTVRNMTVEETWWGRLMAESDARLLRNDSWSGSTVCYTGYAGDCSQTSSFIRRYRLMQEEGFFAKNRVDTVFVFGGTNDSWANAPVGEVQTENFKEEDLFSVLPACDIKQEIILGMAKAGEAMGVSVLQLQGIDKGCGHPSILGMDQICKQILAFLA